MALSIDTETLLGLQQAASEGLGAGASGGAKPSGAVSGTSSLSSSNMWTVPQWEKGFDLAPALQKAYIGASEHMNKMLSSDQLYVDLQPQGEGVIGQVRDVNDGHVVKTYEGLDILRLYSHNVRPRGVIVDGAL